MTSTVNAGMGPLSDGSHVIVLGGGPAGTACAIAVKRLATQTSRDIAVTLLEAKEFVGERHFNACVGVLSPPLESIMRDDLDVPFPPHLSRAIIQGYILHTEREMICLEDPGEPSVALRRVQLDAYMLDAARQRGVDILHARVTDLEFHADGVVVYTDADPVRGDVVVGAFGLDEGTAAVFHRSTGYQPPMSLSSIVTKVHPGEDCMARIGSQLHVFIPKTRGIEFGAITPKGNHLTLNIAGSEVDARLMESFLAWPVLRKVLEGHVLDQPGQAGDLRFYKGRFPRSLAQNGFGDRYVTIGDAAGLVRAFKGKGVTSAMQTGVRAAHALLEGGLSGSALARHYETANQDIIRDLPFGQVMRWTTVWLAQTGLLDTVVRAAKHSPHLRRALYGAASGHAPYREVLKDSLTPASLAAIVSAMIRRQAPGGHLDTL